MDRRTIEIYEREAATYAVRRGVRRPERATAFADAVDRVDPGGTRVDLGCGPGRYLPLLGTPVVAVDATGAMVRAARIHHPDAPAVQADLLHLPLGRSTVAGVWASKAHQHLPAADLPAALAEVHRVLPVGGRFDLTVFATKESTGTIEQVTDAASGHNIL